MPKKIAFKSFPQETLQFLVELRANNSKKWFDAHRSEYEEFYVAPARVFVETIGAKMANVAPDLVAEPKINGSIRRINRDVRFSKDKRPYKDHLDISFWEGEKQGSASSLFFRISPDGVFVGAGCHACPQLLKPLRTAIADPDSGPTLAAVAKKLRRAGHELRGEHYKRMPRGFADDGPAAEFLLHDSIYAVTQNDADSACEPELVKTCVKIWKSLMPLHRWLIDSVEMGQ